MTDRDFRVVGQDSPAVVHRARRLKLETSSPAFRDSVTVQRDLQSIIVDGSAFSLMMGVGELYFPAFVLALGMGEVASGLIATIPLLAGAILQLISPRAVNYLGSARRWVVLCVILQACSFVPLVVIALLGHVPTLLVFLIASWYWGAGMASGPAWSTWIESLVPAPSRARYFARRTRFMQAAMMVGYVGGGLALNWAEEKYGTPLVVFAVLFLIAGVARSVSAVFLARQSEPLPDFEDRRVSPREFVARLWAGGEGRLLSYLMLVQCAAQIASPYFTPYMLSQRGFSYGTYMILIATTYLSKSLALPWLGSLAHRYGTRTLLRIGGVAIVPLASLWLVSASPYYLFCVQLVAGVAWGAYELAMFLMLFESVRPEERTSVLTTFNVGHSAATAGGSLLGGAILGLMGNNPAAYLTVFAVSSATRLVTLPLLALVQQSQPGDRADEARPADSEESHVTQAVA